MFNSHLRLERVVLLRQVLLPEVGGVISAPVAPFEHLLGGDVGVLEVDFIYQLLPEFKDKT
jgi:hypothetical protein